MGLSRNIHIGPFIKIPLQYEEFEKDIKTCGKHENHKGDKFCPICGKEITIQKVSDTSMMWPDDLIGNENFYHYVENDEMFLFSNTKSLTDIDTIENVFTLINSELINEMISDFKEKHKMDIMLLETKINQNVNIQFGFVYILS